MKPTTRPVHFYTVSFEIENFTQIVRRRRTYIAINRQWTFLVDIIEGA